MLRGTFESFWTQWMSWMFNQMVKNFERWMVVCLNDVVW